MKVFIDSKTILVCSKTKTKTKTKTKGSLKKDVPNIHQKWRELDDKRPN